MKPKTVFILSLLASLLGFVLTGLIESIVIIIFSDYINWQLPFLAVAYYGVLGITEGVLMGVLLSIIATIFHKSLSASKVFCISFAGASEFTIISYLLLLIKSIGIRTFSIFGIIIFSLGIIISFWIIYILAIGIYKFIKRLTNRLSIAVIVSYFLLFLITGIIFAVSPEFNRYYKPYNSEMASNLNDKPYILFVLVDCLRRDRISPFGYDIKTPALQTLADDGILFSNAIANSHWTKPTVASIMTSLIPFHHGALQFSSLLPSGMLTLQGVLSDGGYRTVAFSTNPNIISKTGFNNGFNEFYNLTNYSIFPIDYDGRVLINFSRIKRMIAYFYPSVAKRHIAYYPANKLTDKAIDWIKKKRNEKFFMYLHYMDVHSPYYEHPFNWKSAEPILDASPDSLNRYSSLYEGEIEFFDSQFIRLLNYLKQSGIYDSTLIILTADHGEELYDHYGWEHTSSLYDEIVHIPLIMKLPLSANAGTVDSSLISEIDYAPTILKLVGFDSPTDWDGWNIFDSNYHNNCVVMQGRNPGGEIEGVRTLDYKWFEADSGFVHIRYTRYHKNADKRCIYPLKSLYNLSMDPKEKNNLYYSIESASTLDTLRKTKKETMSSMRGKAVKGENAVLSKKDIERLKAIGYIQ